MFARPSTPSAVSVSASAANRRKVLGLGSPNTLRWPQCVPKRQRLKLDTGHRSFCLHRLHVDDGFDRQRFQLTGHLLIIVVSGGVIVERGDELQLGQPGDAVIIPEGEMMLTEVPVPGSTHGEIYYLFFGTAVLRDLLVRNPVVGDSALSMRPFTHEVCPLPGALNRLAGCLQQPGFLFPYQFSRMLTVLINQRWVEMFSSLAKSFCIPKLRLNHFMELQLLEVDRRPGESYPGGAEQLHRDLRLHQGLSPEAWLRQRRAQLARAWVAHSAVAPGEIAAKLGHSKAADFEKAFREDHGVAVEAVSRIPWRDLGLKERQLITTPFWMRSAHALPSFSSPQPPATLDPWHSPIELICRSFLESAALSAPAEDIEPDEAEANFWAATSTIGHVGNVIRGHFGKHSPAVELWSQCDLQAAA